MINSMEQRFDTCIRSYLSELLTIVVLDRGSPPTRKFSGEPNPVSGLIEAVSTFVFASRRYLVLSLDVISTNAS